MNEELEGLTLILTVVEEDETHGHTHIQCNAITTNSATIDVESIWNVAEKV